MLLSSPHTREAFIKKPAAAMDLEEHQRVLVSSKLDVLKTPVKWKAK